MPGRGCAGQDVKVEAGIWGKSVNKTFVLFVMCESSFKMCKSVLSFNQSFCFGSKRSCPVEELWTSYMLLTCFFIFRSFAF